MLRELTDEPDALAWIEAQAACVVEFVSPACGPCRMMEPTLRRVAERLSPRVAFARVDVLRAPGLGERFRIRATPTFARFVDGRLAATRTGALTEPALLRWVDEGGAVPVDPAR